MPPRPTPGASNLARPIDAGGDQHRVVQHAQFFEARVAAEFETETEFDAAVDEPLHAPRDDVFLQFEIRNAVDEQSAGAVVAVVDRDAIAFAAQFFRSREPRRSRADDADMFAADMARLQRLHPAFAPRGVGQIAFDGADGDGAVARLLDDAIAFAQPVLRADAPAHLRHVVGGLRKFISLFEAALRGQLQPVGDVVLERAVDLAERHAALRAARRLRRGLLGDIVRIDLVEVARARFCRPLGRRLLIERDKAQHSFGHGWFSQSKIRRQREVGDSPGHFQPKNGIKTVILS